MDTKKITHLFYRIFKARGSGLERDFDPRTFNTKVLGLGEYAPTKKINVIKTVSNKNQGSLSTCQWNATTIQKEVDEECVLSVRSIVGYGKKMGLLSGEGNSTLLSGQKALKDWGILKEGIIPENMSGWDNYSNVDIERFKSEAGVHKISSYWNPYTANDIIRYIDEGRTMTTGLEWYTGFNQGGGFRAPWIISKNVGYSVGGHAFLLKGYIFGYSGIDKNKKIVINDSTGSDVFVMQNSYGADWGATFIDEKGVEHKGCFFVTMSFLMANYYGAYVNLDIDKNVGQFLMDYDGKNVKGSGPAIYLIQRGTKKPYPNWVTYLSFNGLTRGFSTVDDSVLKQIKVGDTMDIKKSLYWDFLKDLKSPDDINKLLEILNDNNSTGSQTWTLS